MLAATLNSSSGQPTEMVGFLLETLRCASSTASGIRMDSLSKDDIKALICDTCWSELFASGFFASAWQDRDRMSANEKYYVTTGKAVADSAQKGCNWCQAMVEGAVFSAFHQDPRTFPDDVNPLLIEIRFHCNPGPMPNPHLRLSCRIWTAKDERELQLLCGQGRPKKLGYSLQWWEISAPEDDKASAYIKGRGLIARVSEPESYEKARSCIATCIAKHELCREPEETTLPTRLIHCADPSKPKLFISEGLTGSYAALSYVWGEPQEQHWTSTSNMESYIEGIDLHTLPQTIRDAITSTHDLGLEYLWVDALCILQDSKEDKNKEISQIRKIFSKAFVTIVAASSEKVSHGFLRDRPPPPTFCIPFRCPDGDQYGTMVLQKTQTYEPNLEPIATRAWCLEERLLSPRTLIYAYDTVRYCCRTGIFDPGLLADELDSNFASLPNEFFSPGQLQPPELSPSDSEELNILWNSIVLDYTFRKLTKPTDKLIAFSGIAEAFYGVWGGSYLAGVWKHRLPNDLLWCVDAKTIQFSRHSYRAPSWSWASVDGDVHIPPSMNLPYMCDILACTTTPKDARVPFAEVHEGSSLVLSGILRKARWDPESWDSTNQSQLATGPDGQGYFANVWPDCEEDASQGVKNVFLLPVVQITRSKIRESRSPKTLGLMLVQGEAGLRRVGHFLSMRSKIFEGIESERVTIL